ncbi:MAG: subclass B1 metallo-beta-lactamase [Acidobacteriota bacterium]
MLRVPFRTSWIILLTCFLGSPRLAADEPGEAGYLVPGVPAAIHEEVEIHPLEDGLWLHRSRTAWEEYGTIEANGLVIAGSQGAWIIDTAWNEEQTEALIAWVTAEVGPLLGVVATHFHFDGLGGVSAFHRRDLPSWGHQKTAPLAPTWNLEAPRHTFAESAELSTGSGTVELFYPGPGHSPDNIVVWLPERRVLYGGCLIKSAKTRHSGNLEDADVTAWPASLDAVGKRYPAARTVVPGHGDPGDLSLLGHTAKIIASAASP